MRKHGTRCEEKFTFSAARSIVAMITMDRDERANIVDCVEIRVLDSVLGKLSLSTVHHTSR